MRHDAIAIPRFSRLTTAALLTLALLAACARLPVTGVTSIRSSSVGELRDYLARHRVDVDEFRARGPFPVDAREDLQVPISSAERVVADLYVSAAGDGAPLALLLHGHDNTKADHAYQGMHLASWGVHTLVLQLPADGPWIDHGRTLARVAALVQQQPERLDHRLDPRRIILVGHSFGGTAAAVALASGAAAAGAVLLDPASIGWELSAYLRRVSAPLLVLGADEDVFAALDREDFFRLSAGPVAELSIRDASHEDAQFPFENEPSSSATPAHQITFVSALTAGVLSLAYTGGYDYAWASFGAAMNGGKLIHPRKK